MKNGYYHKGNIIKMDNDLMVLGNGTGTCFFVRTEDIDYFSSDDDEVKKFLLEISKEIISDLKAFT